MKTRIDYIDEIIRALDSITPDYHSESRALGKAIGLLHDYQTLLVDLHTISVEDDIPTGSGEFIY